MNPEQEIEMAIWDWVEANESATADIEALEARYTGWVYIWYQREEGRMIKVISDLAAAKSATEVKRISQAAFDWDQLDWPLTQTVVAYALKRFPQHALELALIPYEEGAELDPDALQVIGMAIYDPIAPEEQQHKRQRCEKLVTSDEE